MNKLLIVAGLFILVFAGFQIAYDISIEKDTIELWEDLIYYNDGFSNWWSYDWDKKKNITHSIYHYYNSDSNIEIDYEKLNLYDTDEDGVCWSYNGNTESDWRFIKSNNDEKIRECRNSQLNEEGKK